MSLDFVTRHIMCSFGLTVDGYRTVSKHDEYCEYKDEHTSTEKEPPKTPPQDTVRDMWLLSIPPIGQLKVDATQYEELRVLALKLAHREFKLRTLLEEETQEWREQMSVNESYPSLQDPSNGVNIGANMAYKSCIAGVETALEDSRK